MGLSVFLIMNKLVQLEGIQREHGLLIPHLLHTFHNVKHIFSLVFIFVLTGKHPQIIFQRKCCNFGERFIFKIKLADP